MGICGMPRDSLRMRSRRRNSHVCIRKSSSNTRRLRASVICFEIIWFVYPAEGVIAGDEAVLLAHFGWDRVGEASLLGSLQHFFYALVDFAGVYGVLLGLRRLAIQSHDFAYFVADGV